MDILSIIFWLIAGAIMFVLGYLTGATVFAQNLKDKLAEMGVDKATIDQLLGKKT